MSSVKLLLHHNKAQLPGFLEIDLEKATPSELISAALKQAKLTSSPETYKFYISSYLKDIRSLDSEVKEIKDLELTPLSTIFIIAPDGSKPRRRKKQEKEVEIEITSGDEIEMDIEDVIKSLEKTSGKKRAAILKFGAANGEKLLETKGFSDCSKDTLALLLKDDTFAATESAILDAVLRWAKKKAKKDEDLKKVLTNDILKLVRLPLLQTSDVATKIVPLGILEMQQTLDLFSYTGALQAAREKDKEAKAPALPKSLADFSNKARTPVRIPSKWGRVCSYPVITLSNNNLTATHDSSSGGHSWVISEDTVSKGRKEWKCRIDALQYNNWVMFGVCHTLPNSSNSYTSPGTWGLASSGQTYTNGSSGSSGKYDQYFIQGGNVSCVLDLNALTFTVTVVESGYSYSFPGLPSGHTWWFHVNLHGANDQVTLTP